MIKSIINNKFDLTYAVQNFNFIFKNIIDNYTNNYDINCLMKLAIFHIPKIIEYIDHNNYFFKL